MAILGFSARRIRKIVMAFAILGVLAPVFPLYAANPVYLQESKIKAGLLYNFLKYTKWPAESFTDATSSLQICLFGGDAFEGALDPLQGRTAQQRTINIKKISDFSELKNCHVVFMGQSQKNHLSEILASLRSSSTLTVSDMDHFTRQGGMVGFSSGGTRRIHLYMNYQAIQRARLTVGNELVKLAESER